MPYMHQSADFEEKGLKIEKNCSFEVRKGLLTQLTIATTNNSCDNVAWFPLSRLGRSKA